MNILAKFISTHYKSFDQVSSEKFLLQFEDLRHYTSYLHLIVLRYEHTNGEFCLLVDPALESRDPAMLAQLDRESQRLQLSLHLDIESFYLFAKILLDKIARSIQFYFGEARGRSLDSHDSLTKNINLYVRDKELPDVSEDLLKEISALKSDICDYRDYVISHQKGTGIQRKTKFSAADLYSSITKEKIHLPNPELPQPPDSSIPPFLIKRIQGYLDSIINYLEVNQSHCVLISSEKAA
jgi:hypothetical protein